MTPTNLNSHKPAHQLFASNISVTDARAAALKVVPHLDASSAWEHFAPPHFQVPGATLCQPPEQPPFHNQPSVLFAEIELSVADVPDSWMEAFADWVKKIERTYEYKQFEKMLKEGRELPAVSDSIVAGLLVYLNSASADWQVRQSWLDVALTSTTGSWLAAEGLHTLAEQERILNGVRHDSRLLWSVSQLQGFAGMAVMHAKHKFDFYAGIILAMQGKVTELATWLRGSSSAGIEHADAACAALILQPCAKAKDKWRWIETLKQSCHARQAFEAVRWTQYTWPTESWQELKAALQFVCVGDMGCVCCHWFTHIEPERAAAVLGTESIQLLWAVELIAALPDVDDYAFRFRLAEKLDIAGYCPAAKILDWLNKRWKTNNLKIL